eukprot:PITA_12743
MHMVGTLSDQLLGKQAPIKYEGPGNPVVTIQIQGYTFPNTLVDLGAAINIMTTETYRVLGIINLEPTSTLSELVNKSIVRPQGTLQDVTISIDSVEYIVDFLAINPRNRLYGHPLILGQPWLLTEDVYIGCYTHPPRYLEENTHSPLTLEEALEFKNQMEDDVIKNFISRKIFMNNPTCQVLKDILANEAQGDPSKDVDDQHIPTTAIYNNKRIEIERGKMLNINNNLDSHQEQRLIQVLQKYKKAIASEYSNMKGIDP